jgi:hypothetical protein
MLHSYVICFFYCWVIVELLREHWKVLQLWANDSNSGWNWSIEAHDLLGCNWDSMSKPGGSSAKFQLLPLSHSVTGLVLVCPMKKHPSGRPHPKFSLITSPNLRSSITNLVEKYGNALQLLATVNGLKDEITAVSCISPAQKTAQMLHHPHKSQWSSQVVLSLFYCQWAVGSATATSLGLQCSW